MKTGSQVLRVCLGVLLLLATARSLVAQQGVGGLYGAVTDPDGALLPGVTLTLTGYGERKMQVSDDLGQFRYLGLDPGTWALEAMLDGFSTVEYSTISIEASRSTTIAIELSAAFQDVISVTAESPLLDERKISTGTTLRQIELEKLPMARDPWAVLTQSAGVLVNRIDVGGATSSQQANFRGMAIGRSQNDYVLDGMQITSDEFSNAASIYFDMDQFEEMQVLTGGNDVTKNTPGVAISLVTKRGSNEMRGSARFLLTDGAGYFGALEEADPDFNPGDLGPGQEDFVGNTIDRLINRGFEGGGAAWRDRVWLWGSWSQQDFNTRAGNAEPELRVLDNVAIKVNAQLSEANSLVASYSNSDKLAAGRGAGPNRDPSSTFNQRGPTGITKVEDSHVFGSSFFLTGSYGYVDGGFELIALGGAGPDQPPIPDPGGEVNLDENGFKTNSGSRKGWAPSEELKLDASYFLNTGAVGHEIKFGGRVRETQHRGGWSYPGRGLYHYAGNLVGVQNPDFLAELGLPPERFMEAHVVYAFRAKGGTTEVNTASLWVQDTMTWSRWTLNAGLRYNHQDGENLPDLVAANPGFPEVMPPVDFPGNDADGFAWRTFAPRIGVTYALGEERKTLLRGSLSQFPDSLVHGAIVRTNPLNRAWARLLFLDDPGGFSAFYDQGETVAVLGGIDFDPDDPTSLSSPNITDPDLDPGLLTELVLSAEHAFLPEFVTGVGLTWRRNDRVQEEQALFTDLTTGEVRTAGADEYVFDRALFGELPDGTPYSYDTFAANSNLRSTSGTYLTNGDRKAESFSAAVTLTKRLSNRWMARGFLNYVFTEEWSVPSSYFDNNDPNRTGPEVMDGQGFSPLNSKWQWNLNGMYQVAPERPWGFNVSANLTGREGYPTAYTRNTFGSDRIGRSIMVVENVDDFRYDDVFVADLRLEKEFAATGNIGLTFSIDAFNIFNEGYVLSRNTNLNSGSADWVNATLSPRIFRLGVRVSWR
ncbi:MAG: TonB-dependent receptor [Thermoanaerobaculia bacterium]